MSGETSESGWESGWDGHERAQRERLARLSFAEKLDWLEEAHAMVLKLQGAATVEPPTMPAPRRD